MAERRMLVAGNWKMNGLQHEAAALARDLAAAAGNRAPACEMLVCPPATALATVGGIIAGGGIALGGQDCHAAAKGAFTGDISAEMLKDLGCSYVILGHSERRHGHGETDDEVCAKVEAAWRSGLTAIVCIGETRTQREDGMARAVVEAQLAGSLPPGASADKLVVAYEPVWAIGTGLTASLSDIAEIHAAVRVAVPEGTRILYGGSVNPGNAAGIFALDDVDGGLIGGASLKAADFWAIAGAC